MAEALIACSPKVVSFIFAATYEISFLIKQAIRYHLSGL
jgi:hypothetical protein